MILLGLPFPARRNDGGKVSQLLTQVASSVHSAMLHCAWVIVVLSTALPDGLANFVSLVRKT